jgi:hypothetical protein
MVGPGSLVMGTKTENREIMFNAAPMRCRRAAKSRCFAEVSAGRPLARSRRFADYTHQVFFAGPIFRTNRKNLFVASQLQKNSDPTKQVKSRC